MNHSNPLDPWNVAALRAAASRERSEAVHALIARFAGWLRSLTAARVPQARGRDCLGTGH